MFSPLRNRMGRRLREPFGKAGLTVAILALVMAMVGGAWAAAGLNSKQKKEVKSIAKQFAGKPGATGAPGPQGNPGAAGAAGKDGTNGTNGTNGSNGEGVTIGAASSGECKEGGAKFSNATGTKHACNGSPWTAGGTLPEGSTETGVWAFGPVKGASEEVVVNAASFTIPLSAPLDSAHVHYINQAGEEEPEPGVEVPSTQCLGTALEPKATSGNFCMYTSGLSNVEVASTLGFVGEGTLTSGALKLFLVNTAAAANGFGSWAVTG